MNTKAYDTIILGSGISGLSIAYWLRRFAPLSKTLILDSAQLMSGASSKNAGFLTVGSHAFYSQTIKSYGRNTGLDLLEFSQKNHDLLYDEGLLEATVEYKNHGSFSIYRTDDDRISIPSFSSGDSKLSLTGESCFYYSFDGSCDPQKLLSSMIRQSHAETIGNANINWNPQSAHQIEINGEVLSFGNLFITTNAWLNSYISQPLVTPTRAQILKTQPIGKSIKGNYYFSDHKIYLRQLPDMSLLAGGMRTVDTKTEQTDIEATNPAIIKELTKFVEDRMDISIEVDRKWSGIMGFTENQLPKAGVKNKNHYFMAGFSGHGMGMAFHLGKKLVERSLGLGEIPEVFVTHP